MLNHPPFLPHSDNAPLLLGGSLLLGAIFILTLFGCQPPNSESATTDADPAATGTVELDDASQAVPETTSPQIPVSHAVKPPVEATEGPMETPAISEAVETEAEVLNAPAVTAESEIKEMSASVTDLIAKASGKTPKGEPFIFEEAVEVAGLAAGGFATTPAYVEDFDFGWEATTTTWEIATWNQNQTKMGRERVNTNEEGHLVLTVKAGFPKLGGSIQSKQEFGYGRWIARVRPSNVPGVLNSVFTKDWDDKTTPDNNHDGRKAEVDFEFLTYTFGPDSGEIHLAIHLINKHPLWHVDIPLNFNPSDEFREWGFDILPDRVVWHVDGKLLFAWEYTDEYFIDPMYEFFFNAWTKKTWIQGPPTEDAHYHIDWLKFYPYEG